MPVPIIDIFGSEGDKRDINTAAFLSSNEDHEQSARDRVEGREELPNFLPDAALSRLPIKDVKLPLSAPRIERAKNALANQNYVISSVRTFICSLSLLLVSSHTRTRITRFFTYTTLTNFSALMTSLFYVGATWSPKG